MVVGEILYQLALIERFHASVHQRLLYLFDLLKESLLANASLVITAITSASVVAPVNQRVGELKVHPFR